ncbi:MAG: hypothetical protein DRI89_12485 [Bacteroidetes bacterium]|nr:MAG: hypothetical protein DRI89_12485 [Bacteroidota bacterium]
MKKISILLTIVLGFTLFSCDNPGDGKISTDVVDNTKTASGTYDASIGPRFEFDETEHNFGNMIQGEKVSYDFQFTNTGGADLIINKVSTSCGCTASNYPKTAIKPGEISKIEVTFDSRHKKGHQNKSIAIIANTEPNRTVLRVKARVLMPEKN